MYTADISCLACGHTHPVPNATGLDAKQFFASEIFVCSECGARMAYGKLLPRIVVEPYLDDRGHQWLRRRFQDAKTKADIFVVDVDPQYAASECKNTLALVIP